MSNDYKPIATRPLFEVSDELRAALESCYEELPDFPGVNGAYLLDPGLGPPTYLTGDGRVLWEDDIWDVKPTRRQAFMGIAVGYVKTGVSLLKNLLPSRPLDANDCVNCKGTGRVALPVHDDSEFSVVCGDCGGVGFESSAQWLDGNVEARPNPQ